MQQILWQSQTQSTDFQSFHDIDLLNAVEVSGGNVGGDSTRHSYFLSSIPQSTIDVNEHLAFFCTGTVLPIAFMFISFVCLLFGLYLWFMFKLSGGSDGSGQFKDCRFSACRLQPFFFLSPDSCFFISSFLGLCFSFFCSNPCAFLSFLVQLQCATPLHWWPWYNISIFQRTKEIFYIYLLILMGMVNYRHQLGTKLTFTGRKSGQK